MEEQTKSRQANWQAKMMAQHRCCICGKKAFLKKGRFRRYCLKHMIWHREYQRVKKGSLTRYKSITYLAP